MSRVNENPIFQIVQLAKAEQENGRTLTPDRIKPLLNEKITARMIPKGEYITTVNSTIKKVYYVLSGSYMILRSSIEGRNRIVVKEKAPKFLYVDHAVLSDNTSDADILALESCFVLEINNDYFIQSMKENGELGLEVLHMICQRFSVASRRSDQIMFYDTPTKFMIYIINYWLTHHNDKETCIIAVKNAHIADEIGISARTFYRTLDKLKKDKLLSVSVGNITVTYEQITRMRSLCRDIMDN